MELQAILIAENERCADENLTASLPILRLKRNRKTVPRACWREKEVATSNKVNKQNTCSHPGFSDQLLVLKPWGYFINIYKPHFPQMYTRKWPGVLLRTKDISCKAASMMACTRSPITHICFFPSHFPLACPTLFKIWHIKGIKIFRANFCILRA